MLDYITLMQTLVDRYVHWSCTDIAFCWLYR